QLYANGELLLDEAIEEPQTATPGVQRQQTWKLPRPRHDLHYVVMALGDGIEGGHWKTARPYQPTSPQWRPVTFGVSGAVWIDADADEQRSSARQYAEQQFAASKGDLTSLV